MRNNESHRLAEFFAKRSPLPLSRSYYNAVVTGHATIDLANRLLHASEGWLRVTYGVVGIGALALAGVALHTGVGLNEIPSVIANSGWGELPIAFLAGIIGTGLQAIRRKVQSEKIHSML